MQPVLLTSWAAYQRTFGQLAWYAMVSWSVYEFFNEGGTACYVVRASDRAGASCAGAKLPVALTAATPGPWGNALSIMISNASASSSGVTPAFNLAVLVEAALVSGPDAAVASGMPNLLLRQYVLKNGLSAQTFSRSASDSTAYYVLEQFNGLTASEPAALASRINSSSMFIRVPLSPAISARPPNGGPVPLAGGSIPDYDLGGATALLEQVKGISLLSVPDTVTATDAGGRPSLALQGALVKAGQTFCSNQRSLFYVIDPPFGLSVQDIVSFRSGQGQAPDGNPTALDSDDGALYYPWLYIGHPATAVNVPIPPSGPVLGRYAYTDSNVGVFKSPAGVNDGLLASAVLLDLAVSDAAQNVLTPEGVNVLRDFGHYGNVIWGARTLSRNAEWTYVSVRRLFIYVEQSLRQSLQWAVFEASDQRLWSSITRDVTAFLTSLWQQGALYGATPQEAFFVTCDASNNPPEARMEGLAYIDIGLAPVYPAEFIVLRLVQKTGGANAGN